MSKSELISLGTAVATDIREVSKPGLVLPIRDKDHPLLLTEVEGKVQAMMLGGPQAFDYFSVSLVTRHTGLFFADPEILVDLSSAMDGVGREDDKGLLFLTKDELGVVGEASGDSFGYPHILPLWKTVDGGSDAAKVAFTRWGIGIPHGDGFRTLWKREAPAKSSVELYENA